MAATETDILMTGEKKDYDFDFSLKASIVAGETLDDGTPATIEVIRTVGPGGIAELTHDATGVFDVPNNIVQVQNVIATAAAAGTKYILKVSAQTVEGNILAVTGEVHVQLYA